MPFSDNNVLFDELNLRTSTVQKTSIGRSWLGRDIDSFRAGHGARSILLIGGFRGADAHISAFLSKLIMCLDGNPETAYAAKSLNIARLLESVTVYIIPRLNPDGMILHNRGSGKTNPLHDRCVRINGGSTDFSSWQANAKGVDIAKNFNSCWPKMKLNEKLGGITAPSPSGYSGEYPESEFESIALCRFSNRIAPSGAICFMNGDRKILCRNPGAKKPRLISGCTEMPLADIESSSEMMSVYAAGSFSFWCENTYGIFCPTILLNDDEPQNDRMISKILLCCALM